MTTTLKHEDIRWRVSNTWEREGKKWGMLVGYIDSRTAMDALDALDPNWSTKMEPVALNGDNGIRCTLIVNGVAREDVGVASNIDALKGAFSDALKRAAVHFGIGRELYELPKIAVECEVGRDGKVKAPKALPTFRNGRWDIDRKVGWVKYEREPVDDAGEPDEQPEPGNRGGTRARQARAGSASSAPAPRSAEEQALLDELLAVPGMSRARLSLLADAVHVKGERADADELRAMLVKAREPLSEPAGPGAARAPGPDSDAAPEGSAPGEDASGTATDPAGGSPLPAGSGNPTMDDVLAVTGGEEVPPKPGSDEYKALKPHEKAAARAYHSKPAEPVQETLNEALGTPLAE